MNTRRAVFIHSPELDRGGYPQDCPFDSRRAGMTRKTLHNMGLLKGKNREEVHPQKASALDLKRFHTAPYLEEIRKAEQGELSPLGFSMGLGTPDCPIFQGMFDYISLAVGGSLTGVRLILSASADIAFNPSGGFHHAGPETASGFCFINDVVIAAMILTDAGRRVLILDLDVHHGDGVQDAFYERSDVMVISLHESGDTLFPGTGSLEEIGRRKGEGFNVNIPLPVGTHDTAYAKAFEQVAMPLISKFDPDVIVMELGMDALSGDPLAHLNLTNNVHADIIESVLKFNRPVFATGGGGYHVENTVRAWALAWQIFCGDDTNDLSIGMGGVMLETTEWAGGLRDRMLQTDARSRIAVEAEVDLIIQRLHEKVFPLHGIP